MENIISNDDKMAKIFELVEEIADSNTTILITGPAGSGKSMLAKAIHYRSSRRDKAFVEIDWQVMSHAGLARKLFGHVKRAEEGEFVASDEGTIFLEEVASTSPALQARLLRLLEDGEFKPVCGNKTKSVDTRILLGSRRDLAEEVRQGKFREDFYQRINAVTIKLPPLHERVGDVSLLAKHFLKFYRLYWEKNKLWISDEAMGCLERYSWPGNVGELQKVIEFTVIYSKEYKLINPWDLPALVTQDQSKIQSTSGKLYKQSPFARVRYLPQFQFTKELPNSFQDKMKEKEDPTWAIFLLLAVLVLAIVCYICERSFNVSENLKDVSGVVFFPLAIMLSLGICGSYEFFKEHKRFRKNYLLYKAFDAPKDFRKNYFFLIGFFAIFVVLPVLLIIFIAIGGIISYIAAAIGIFICLFVRYQLRE